MGVKGYCEAGRSLIGKWRTWSRYPVSLWVRSLRSNAALEAIAKASEEKVPNVVLYNYPSFSGAYSALSAHLFHSHHNIPCLILPFSSVEPLRVEDLTSEGLETCYLLDFLCPKEFLLKLSQQSECKVIGFDHRKSAISCIPDANDCPENLTIHASLEKSSSGAVYEYFSTKHADIGNPDNAASKLLGKVFRVRLGRGFYGECLGVRADGNSNLSDEIGKLLSAKSAAAGLRPVGAVIFMQRNNLKMCLRSTDNATDTSEIAKAYGGGGSPSSSSFIIRMDEYNQWIR